MSNPQVRTYRALGDLAPLRQAMETLNLASRRPCPFSTLAYLEAWVEHDEYAQAGDELLFLAAFDGDRLVGYLPLRRRVQKVLGLPAHRLGLLVEHDTDRPHVVARPEDEPRCAEAFYHHLMAVERRWSFLELLFQDEESALSRPPPLSRLRYHVRRFENMPNTTLRLPFTTLHEYFRSLDSTQRKQVASFGRRLMAQGPVETLSSADPAARAALLDLYLDLERRSWKETARAGIRRNPRRVEFFRRLCRQDQPLLIRFDFVLLDGLPLAGLVSGAYGGGSFGLETAFDESFADVAPGRMLSLMATGSAIRQGDKFCNYDGNYAYYKQRWGGVVTPTAAVQIYRVGGPHWIRAQAGDLKRRLRPAAKAEEVSNPERRRATQGEHATPAQPGAADQAAAPLAPARADRSAERAHARQVVAELQAAGARLERLAGPALEAALPYPLRTKGS